MSSQSEIPPGWAVLPDDRRRAAAALFQPGEHPLVWFEPDLDGRLTYRHGLALLTSAAVYLWPSDGVWEAPAERPVDRVVRWPLAEITVAVSDWGGLGRLELFGPDKRWFYWRFSAGLASAASQFARRVDLAKKNEEVNEAGSVCPSCGSIIPPGVVDCPACATAPVPPPGKSLMRLTRFAHRRAGPILLGFVLTLASTAAGLIPPYLTMPLLDNVLIPLQNKQAIDFSLVPKYLAGLGLAAILAWLLSWGRTYVLAWVGERISADIRDDTYAHLQKLSLEFFGGKRTGDLISRLSSDTDRICYFLSVTLVDFGSDVLMIVLTAGILLWIDPMLAIVTLVPFPAIAWLIQQVRSRLRHGFAKGSSAWGEMVSVLADTIPGIRVVKAFAQESREIERFQRTNEYVLDANLRVNKTWAFFGPMVTLLTEGGLLVIWACGAYRVAQGFITVGVLTAFVAYISRFYTRLESMSRMVAAVQRAGAATHRVFEILDRVPSVPEPVTPVHPGRVQGSIELRHVLFRYGRRPVIKGVDLSIRPGELIGLVGPSGAGKSTLVNLVCRFYDVNEGAILVDGQDIRSFPVEEYRRNIGIVLQDPFLFYGTIAENIAYGRPSATRSEIITAARAANAHEFILRLSDGYDSLVGERGQSLSGGERQRISIARALLTDPRILILDEATSSVDTETEREIQAALDNLIHGRTTIAIAHRLSTLRKADRLVVLENGQITETGRHFELLEKPAGAYARLHQAQLDLASSGA